MRQSGSVSLTHPHQWSVRSTPLAPTGSIPGSLRSCPPDRYPGRCAPAHRISIRGRSTSDHRMDPRDTRRPRRAAQEQRRRGAGRSTVSTPLPCPQAVTVERPRNPEHGDYATNLALQLGKKVGASPRELAGWLAEALAEADGIASAEVAGPGFVNLRLEASAQGVIVSNIVAAGANYGRSRPARRSEGQPRVRLGQPDRPDPHRRHPLGRGRRCAGPAAEHPGCRGGPRVLLQRPRRADRPVRQLADRRRQRPTGPGGRLRRRLHQRHRRPGARQGARRAEPARRRAARDVPVHRRGPDVQPHQELVARVRHRLRRLHPRRLDAHQRARRSGDRQAA